ncbi:FAD-binding protein [Pseudomonas synxantha]
MSHFDVVVVGGGPAGCAAAIHCAGRYPRCLRNKGQLDASAPGS